MAAEMGLEILEKQWGALGAATIEQIWYSLYTQNTTYGMTVG